MSYDENNGAIIETGTQPQESVDNVVDTPDAQTSAPETADTQTSAEAEKPVQTEGENQTFTVKYNGEEKQLSRDEMISFAQKGMNYDKVRGQLDGYQNNKAMQQSYALVQHYANLNGMTVENYLAQLHMEREQAENQRFANENNIPVEQAANLRRMQQEANAILAENKLSREMQELFTDYPDLKTEEITDEVLRYRLEHNVSLKVAYQLTAGMQKMAAEKAELEQKLKIREEGEQNNGISTGSTKGAGNDTVNMGGISKMSLDDYEKQSDAIWANLKRRI